ncbi:pilin N-terminal domain-containing protein [Peptoniphilus genitalis]
MNKKKIMSLIMALVMLVGVFSPLTAFADNTSEPPKPGAKHKTTVNIHKVLMDKEEKVKGTEETLWSKFPKEHDGSKITDIQGYFGASAKLIAGVQFDIYKEGSQSDQGAKLGSEIASSVFEASKYYVLVKSVKTEGDPAKAEVTLEDGTYYVAENKKESTYLGEKGEKLTGMKAVPFKLVLPIAMPDGKKNYDENDPLNIYPKNTEDKVVATKDFAKKSDEDATTKTKKLNATENDPDYKKYLDEKETVNQTVGKEVPYIVKTKIPKDAVLTNLNWSDLMDKGLTYNDKSLNVTISPDKEIIKAGQIQTAYTTWFTLTKGVSGFTLEATPAGLKEINKLAAAGEVEFKLNYSATVNEKAVVDTPMDNHITVDYGNKPDGGFEVTNKTKVKVTKKWATGTAPANAKVKYFLIDKTTGEVVDQVEKSGSDLTHEFTGLDASKTYTVKEVVNGYRPTYKATNDGVEVTNTSTPTTIVPTPPKVETYGKKFVKGNGDKTQRLGGAEFVVKTPAGKYLTIKDAAKSLADKSAFKTADKAYTEAIDKANKILAKPEDQRSEAEKNELKTLQDKTEGAAGSLLTLQKARDKAYEDLNMEWTETDDEKQAFVFTSNNNGQFEVMGLEQGEYTLKEIKAPAGYAVPSNPEKTFKVGPNTASTVDVDFKYVGTETDNNAKFIENTKVTIPQTGGMGTVLFTVVGISLMAGAVVAMKRNREEA